jgi:hypothetical protein
VLDVVDFYQFLFGSAKHLLSIERLRRFDGSLVWTRIECTRISGGPDSVPVFSATIQLLPNHHGPAMQKVF